MLIGARIVCFCAKVEAVRFSLLALTSRYALFGATRHDSVSSVNDGKAALQDG